MPAALSAWRSRQPLPVIWSWHAGQSPPAVPALGGGGIRESEGIPSGEPPWILTSTSAGVA